MPFLQSSIEGAPPPADDPWDWNVEQVVFAFTNRDSPLMRSNGTLSLPDSASLASLLRKLDVNGLALLTLVKDKILRDEWCIKSMSHRASISHLTRLLQDQSQKYAEHMVASGRVSSFGSNSRFAIPNVMSPQQYVPRTALGVTRLLKSPMSFGGILQTAAGIDDRASTPDGGASEPDNIFAGAEASQTGPGSDKLISISPQLDHVLSEPRTDSNVEDRSDDWALKTYINLDPIGHKTPETSSSKVPDRTQHEQGKRQGETIIFDETGRKRRRLVLGPSAVLVPANLQEAVDPSPERSPKSSNTPAESPKAIEPVAVSSISMLEQSTFEDSELLIGSHEPPSTTQNQLPEATMQVPEPKAGTISLDERGRKRLRPILLTQPDLSAPTTSVPVLASEEDRKQQPYGRKLKRAPNQLYAGTEPMSVDELFYSDVGLEMKLEKTWVLENMSQKDLESDSGNFRVVSRDAFSNGQRLYVNARMKYFLRSQRLPLQRNGLKHIGIIPYPDRLGRKHRPLSMTVFVNSHDGVTTLRSNRSKWMRNRSAPRPESNGYVFNVADPVLAQDENEDPEWTALEKWKYVDGEDKILPLYGDSGSEGEYELDTWREIEQERGEISRPLGQSKHQKLTGEEVDQIIDISMKQLIQDWKLKKLPELQRKAWRFWVRSRRHGDTTIQMRSLTFKTDELDVRINNLKKKIAAEVWSRKSQILKQCKIMQPSVFAREDNKWRMALLRSKRAPVKPPPAPKKPRIASVQEVSTRLRDDEEELETDAEASESSDDSLDDFVVQDEVELENNEGILGDDDLSMSDVDDEADFEDTASKAKDNTNCPSLVTKNGILEHSGQHHSDSRSPMGIEEETSIFLRHEEPLSGTYSDRHIFQNQPDRSNFIDLTQLSDPMEPVNPTVKPEPSYDIKTPPLFDSENDSEIFRRSRGKKPPVFRKPMIAHKSANIIDLDTDSTEVECQIASKALPAFTDVDAIEAMESSELVKRQDRKRVLIWMIAHTPSPRRKASFDYLNKSSVDQSHIDVTVALQNLRSHKQRLRGKDKDLSESIMQIAIWQICWTIPVKADISGVKTRHVIATLEDKDGYGPFHEFLLDCMSHYKETQGSPKRVSSVKKREKIVREDTEDPRNNSLRQRKYRVQESQATLDKRRAAQDRLHADEERRRPEERRRAELKDRFAELEKEGIELFGVVMNPGKLEDQDFVYLNPRFGNGVRLRPHQKAGLQFLWREITADHDDLQGCLLAQTMGLGKTMQIIALIVALSEASHSPNQNIRQQVPPTLRESRTLVLCPPALVENWWDEFILWVPHPSSENIGEVRKVSSSLVMTERLDQIHTWSKEGGVLLIGYDAFKGLVNNKSRAAAKARPKKTPLDDSEHFMIKEALVGSANLVIADEAHYFKTRSTAINLAMNQIRTKSRVALTGSPLNNNLEEYYTLIDWIAPNYLGTRTEFKATYEEPIREGLYKDSTQSQKRTSMKKLKALELEMEPKVHRVSASVLQNDLKGKSEFVVMVALTELQEMAYNVYVGIMGMASRENEPQYATLWTWLGVLQLLCNHPKCYWQTLHKPRVNKTKQKPTNLEHGMLVSEEDAALPDEPVSQVALSQVIEKSRNLFENLTQPLEALCLSNKMQVLMQILCFASAAHDKVLVFSHRIATLDYIAEQLSKASKAYARIDGTLVTNKRQQISKDFNMGEVNICLISTRAGGTGLNFYGANRVVIMDENFNPTWEQQAIGRAYRIGQRKHVYVYRLQAAGTFEGVIQNQGLFKEQLANRVVDKKNPTRSASKGTGKYFLPPKRIEQQELGGHLGKDPLVLDKLLNDRTNHILSITPSEIFHIEDNENLTAAEKREAEQMQKDEQLRRRDPAKYFAMIERRRQETLHKVLQATQVPTTSGLQQASMRITKPAGGHDKITGPELPLEPSTIPPASHPPMTDADSLSIAPPVGTRAQNMPPPTTGLESRVEQVSRDDRSDSTPASTLHAISEGNGPPSSIDVHTRSSSAGPSALATLQPALTPESNDKHLLDRQLLIPDPSPTASEASEAEILDALSDAVANLFRHTNESPYETPSERGTISKVVQDAAQEEFYAIMSEKGLRNPRVALADAARKLYARELSHIISERSINEAEHHRFVSGVEQLLERDEIKPKHLVKVMMERHHPVGVDSVAPPHVEVPKRG